MFARIAPPAHIPRALLILVLAGVAPSAADAQIRRSGAGATAADILPTVDAFRGDLGAPTPDNATIGGFGVGRREINWEGVGIDALSPNGFPSNFFNLPQAGRARGAEFTTPGTQVEVNPNAGQVPDVLEFSNLDPSYPANFAPFSGQKMFTSVGSNIVDVTFFVPGTTRLGVTRGFGAVFSDVDLAGTTSLEFFDDENRSLGTFFAPNSVGDETFSFFGASFSTPIVRRVRITSGNAALAPGVLDQNGNPIDLVVMDDFIYGEVVATPEPATWALMAGGLVGVLGIARRRRAA